MFSKDINQTSWLTDTNLKAYYRFEAGALTTDSSGEGHTLTAISDPAEDASGKFGGAVALDGNDAYSHADHADFEPTGNFTVGCWFKISTIDGTYGATLFQNYSANTNISGYRLRLNTTGGLYFASGLNNGVTQGTHWQAATEASTRRYDGLWHFAVGTWDGSNLNLYCDGELVSQVAWANAPVYAATTYIRIGSTNTAGSELAYTTGSLDDLFILNGTALTATQISNLYFGAKRFNGANLGATELVNNAIYSDSNLEAYYRFSQGALTTDSSGNSHTLTAISTPFQASGKFGGGVYMTTDDGYSATDGAALRPATFSIGFWTLNPNNGGYFQCNWVNAASKFYGYLLYSDGTNPNIVWADGTGTSLGAGYQRILGSGATMNDGEWHHVVYTYDGTNARVYCDGQLVGGPTAYGLAWTTSHYWRMGCRNDTGANGNFFTGYLDDFFILNGTVLTITQINSIYSGDVKTINGLALASVKTLNGV